MRHLKRSLGLVALAGGVAFAMPAVATQWLTSSATGTTAGMTMTVGSGATAHTVKVRAYSTKDVSSAYNTSAPYLGTGKTFQAADLYKYTSGFGIDNLVGGDLNECGSGTCSPEHAVDNNQIYDVLVFELPSSGFDLEGFRLGWAQEGYYGSTFTNGADIQAYFGGNDLGANYDFKNACFTGGSCTNTAAVGSTPKKGDLNFLGFTDLMTGTNPVSGSNVVAGTPVLTNGTEVGRYLIMTGALLGTNDNFKVDMIKGHHVVPAPGTLALLGLGLFGLVTLKRRPAFA